MKNKEKYHTPLADSWTFSNFWDLMRLQQIYLDVLDLFKSFPVNINIFKLCVAMEVAIASEVIKLSRGKL